MSQKAGAWTLDVTPERVGILTIDLPGEKVNKLSMDVLEDLDAMVAVVERDGALKALIIASGKSGCFFAGADIAQIASVTAETAAYELCRRAQTILQRLADLKVPTAAAIDGTCLGGGLELALACRYRAASDSPGTMLGFPETKLGIFPAFGGTQRLPRVIGLQGSIGMILKGNNVDARKALKMGLVDACAPRGLLLETATKLAIGLGHQAAGTRRMRLADILLEKTPWGRNLVFKKARESVLKATSGRYPAPLAALDVIKKTFGGPMGSGLETEARAVAPLAISEVSKNLIHLFYLSEGVKKKSGAREGVAPAPVTRAGVLGAGTMGAGISRLLAESGIQVRLKEIAEKPLGRALAEIRSGLDKMVEKRSMKPLARDLAMARISPALGYEGFQTLDLVIEAVTEELEAKRAVLREVEKASRNSVIFATNTSTIPITKIAEGSARPDLVVGLHFFHPVSRMPLAEVIKGKHTAEETAATAFALAKKLGKVPVLCGDGPGFLVNRILLPYMNEAIHLLADGIDPYSIDGAMLDFGMPMGPLRLMDEVGLDVASHAQASMESAFPLRMKAPPLSAQISSAGLVGKKGGAGFFIYDASGNPRAVNRVVADMLPKREQAPPPEIIVERLTLPMIGEAARVLEERIVSSPGDIDLGMVMGTGFPPFRGGLMRYADALGPARLLDRLKHWSQVEGNRYEPPQSIVEMAKKGALFCKERE